MPEDRPVARIIEPTLDAEEVVWLGSGSGTVRKVYRIIKTPYFNVGMAFFTPGEGGSVHVHENAEEFSYSLSGGGTALGRDNEVIGKQTPGMIKWNPAGSFHGGRSDLGGVSRKIWAYSAGGQLPGNDGTFSKGDK